MKVVSTNTGKKRVVEWQGKSVETGIYKTPTSSGIELAPTHVIEDEIADTRVHGGIDKACYLYSADHYAYWKALHPNLDWSYGMFGENLTVEGFDETQVMIGDTYAVGEAIIQITEPRQPCFKLGIKFNTQEVLKQFINTTYSGVYSKILQTGSVASGDGLTLLERNKHAPTVSEVFMAIFNKTTDPTVLDKILNDPALQAKYGARLQRTAN